ncbi:MAG: hypothetical protein RBT81_12835 [Gammaproteobacteria bacterium]|nr:hypothetical protein [Gammaproteobacteria bacterium]
MDLHGKDVYGVDRLRRALTQFVGGRIVQGLGQAMLVLTLVRVLSPADFGIYMLLIGLAETMLAIGSLGTLQAGRRFVPRFVVGLPGHRLRGIIVLLIAVQLCALALITAMLGLMWHVVSPVIGLSDEYRDVARIALLLFVLVPAMNFSCELLDSLLEQGRSRLVVSLLVFGRIAGIGVLLALSASPLELRQILLLDAVLVGMVLLLSYLLLWRSLGRLRNPDARGAIPWAEMMRFARHMVPVDLLGACSSPGALRLVVTAALGAVDGGMFAFLQSLQRLAGRYLPGTLLRGIVMPMLVARSGLPGGRAMVETGASVLVKSNLMMVSAGAVIIAVCGDELVVALSGDRFQNAGETLLLLYVGLAVTGQRATIEMVMQVLGYGAVLGATALVAPLALIGMWLVAPYGLNWAILVMIVASALANGAATLVLARGPGGFEFEWGGQARIVVSALLASAIGLAITASGGSPIAWGAVSLMALLLMQPLLRPFTATEVVMVEKALGANLVTSGLRLLSRSPSGDGGARDEAIRGTER